MTIIRFHVLIIFDNSTIALKTIIHLIDLSRFPGAKSQLSKGSLLEFSVVDSTASVGDT